MPLVTLKPGSHPVDVEGFPDGALSLYSGTYREVSTEELEKIRSHPGLADQLVVFPDIAPPAPAQTPAAPTTAAQEQEPEPLPPAPTAPPTPQGQRKNRRT